MNCKQIQKHIDDYRAGNLDRVLRESIEKHLERCPDCRRIEKHEESVTQFLRQAGDSHSDISVADVLLKKLAEIDQKTEHDSNSENEPFRDSRFKWIMIAGFLLGAALIGALVIPFESKQDFHSVGSRSGPGYTWMGDNPIEDPMETRWHDPELIQRDLSDGTETDVPHSQQDSYDEGRVLHVLEFGGSSEQSITTVEENP